MPQSFAPDLSRFAQADLLSEVAEMIVTALNLEIAAPEIDPDAPLYGAGLGLDSIDVLEVALGVSKRYGFSLRADNEDNLSIFASLRSLCNFTRREPRPMSHPTPRTFFLGLMVLVAAGYLLLAHLTTAPDRPSALGALIAILPLMLFGFVMAWRSSREALGLWLAGVAALAWAWPLLEARFGCGSTSSSMSGPSRCWPSCSHGLSRMARCR